MCSLHLLYPDSKDGNSSPQSSFSSSESSMKNLPKAMSNMFGASGGIPGDSPTFTITMREYGQGNGNKSWR